MMITFNNLLCFYKRLLYFKSISKEKTMHKLYFFLLLAFLLFTGTDCKKENPPIVPPDDSTTVDTTSHNFTFTQYTFGGSAGSSYFKDVAIINDSDIWAVGEINTDSGMYNAVHWDGKTWELRNVPYIYQGKELIHPINGVFALNKYEVWFVGNGVERWDGQAFSNVEGVNAVWGSFAMQKIWMNSINDIYIIGDGGSIAHYDGLMWTKQESGTTIDLRDVWGSPDGKTVWACGYSNDNKRSILLKYTGTIWSVYWNVENGRPPYGDVVISLWGETNLYSASNLGIYKQNILNSDTVSQSLPVSHFPYRIRGSGENNIAVVGDFGMIWHYNGASWKLLNETVPEQPRYSVAVSKKLIIGVGSDYGNGFGAGLIFFGRRQ